MGIRHPHKPSEYPSFWLYLLDETHVTVTLSTALILLYTHDAHVLWFSVGALGSTWVAKVLKLCLRAPRPPPPPPESKPSRVRPKKTYGMPSTHSTALTFYWVYLLPMIPSLTPIVIRSLGSVSRHLASLLARLPLLEGSARVLEQPIQLAALNRGYPSFGSTLLGAGLTGLWAAGLWSRVELGYHTPQQVFAGAALGAVLAPAWALAWVNNPDLGAVVQRSIDMVWEEVVGRVLG